MDDRVGQRLPGERETGQAIRHENRQRQAADHAQRGNAKAQREDPDLVRAETGHGYWIMLKPYFSHTVRAAAERR